MSGTIALGITSSVLNSQLEDKILAIAKELGVQARDPFEVMAVLMFTSDDEDLKGQMAKELAKYLRPQLKSIDLKHSGAVQKTFAIVRYSDIDPQKAAALAKGLTPAELMKQIAPNAAVIDHMRRDLEKEVVDGGVVTEAAVEVVVASEDQEVPDDYPGKKHMHRFDRYK